jgi:hypothetical protein
LKASFVEHDMGQRMEGQYGAGAGADAEESPLLVLLSLRHVAEEVVDVGEEVLVGEDVLLMGVRDEGQ